MNKEKQKYMFCNGVDTVLSAIRAAEKSRYDFFRKNTFFYVESTNSCYRYSKDITKNIVSALTTVETFKRKMIFNNCVEAKDYLKVLKLRGESVDGMRIYIKDIGEFCVVEDTKENKDPFFYTEYDIEKINGFVCIPIKFPSKISCINYMEQNPLNYNKGKITLLIDGNVYLSEYKETQEKFYLQELKVSFTIDIREEYSKEIKLDHVEKTKKNGAYEQLQFIYNYHNNHKEFNFSDTQLYISGELYYVKKLNDDSYNVFDKDGNAIF